MSKYILVCDTMNTRRQVYDLINTFFDKRNIVFLYNEVSNWEKKFCESNGWEYRPVYDYKKLSCDMIITQNLPGDYFKYLNEIKTNTMFWLTTREVYNRYKRKLNDWEFTKACLDGGNQHFYFSSNLVFFEKDQLMEYINREENFKIILGGTE